MSNLINHTNVYLDILGYSDRPQGEKALIDALITSASNAIEKRCRRTFISADYEELQNGTDDDSIFVLNPPINSLESITILSATETEYDSDSFQFDPEVGEIRWNTLGSTFTGNWWGCFPKGFRNIQINYNGGFDDDAIPEDLQMLVAQVVIQLFHREDADYSLIQDKKGNSYIKFDQNKILHPHSATLSQYKMRFKYLDR